MMTIQRVAVMLFAIPILTSCSTDDKKICNPGDTQICKCNNGSTGSQTCNNDGLSWAKCSPCLSNDLGIDFKISDSSSSEDTILNDIKLEDSIAGPGKWGHMKWGTGKWGP